MEAKSQVLALEIGQFCVTVTFSIGEGSPMDLWVSVLI
jgi:hypothetical protein